MIGPGSTTCIYFICVKQFFVCYYIINLLLLLLLVIYTKTYHCYYTERQEWWYIPRPHVPAPYIVPPLVVKWDLAVIGRSVNQMSWGPSLDHRYLLFTYMYIIYITLYNKTISKKFLKTSLSTHFRWYQGVFCLQQRVW